MTLSHIVAASKNNVIGTQGDLPWSLPEDLKFFREKTQGHAMIMGRKTFESFPNQKPLPHRLNVVITRQKNYQAPGAYVCSSLEEAINYCKERQDQFGEEIFIIGGGEIYQQSLSLVDRVYLTRIYQEFQGDTTYPSLKDSEFKLVEQRDFHEPVDYSFLTYERI